MQDGDVEELVLSGKLFNGQSSSSPERSSSPSDPYRWPEVNSDYESGNDEDPIEREEEEEDVLDELEDTSGYPKVNTDRGQLRRESIGMKPGRTGVKGVLKDQKEHIDLEREKRGRKVREMNERMERMNLGGMTFMEEQAFDDERQREKEEEEGKVSKSDDWRGTKVELKTGRFGHLREVGMSNFVSAIEDEEPGVWVIVHLYDQASTYSVCWTWFFFKFNLFYSLRNVACC
jgi:hypothetical protein